MRQFLIFAALATGVGLVQADQAGTIKCKVDGLHMCCTTCEKSVKAVLDKVDGVTALKVDRNAADKVIFEAKSEKEANEALAALLKGGFCCKVMAGAKELTPVVTKLDVKADSLTFKDVHVCCATCQKTVRGLFPDLKLTFIGKGQKQMQVILDGKNLEAQKVLETLQKAGFSGTLDVKK